MITDKEIAELGWAAAMAKDTVTIKICNRALHGRAARDRAAARRRAEKILAARRTPKLELTLDDALAILDEICTDSPDDGEVLASTPASRGVRERLEMFVESHRSVRTGKLLR